MSSEIGSDMDSGLTSVTQSGPLGSVSEATSPSPGSGQSTQPGSPSGEGRRTQLRIVRQNIEILSGDVRKFRKSHEASAKSLEKQVASLRKELAAHARADKGRLGKDSQASAKRMEKQVSSLHKELSDLKVGIAKDAAKSRARQEAVLSKILAKVSAKPKAAKKGKR